MLEVLQPGLSGGKYMNCEEADYQVVEEMDHMLLMFYTRK